jgi:hypothetical protein
MVGAEAPEAGSWRTSVRCEGDRLPQIKWQGRIVPGHGQHEKRLPFTPATPVQIRLGTPVCGKGFSVLLKPGSLPNSSLVLLPMI